MNASSQNVENSLVESPEAPVWTVLFVDDEDNILNALRRLFRPAGYRVLTAGSGAEALALLQQEQVDLVVSDMRMPHMNGAELLEQVYRQYPDTMRVLLTGHADIGMTVDAINKGQILRYIAKPWDDNDMLVTVRQALERKQLERDKQRLEQLARKQNEALKQLNAELEEKVQQRTEELRQAMGFLEVAHKQLKDSFLTSIKVFAGLIELRERTLAGHSRRVADTARTLAKKMGLVEQDLQDVFIAGLLHDIGKIGMHDRALSKPFIMLVGDDRDEAMRHPVTGQAVLMGLEPLHGAAKLIRSHHERFDGMGYPDGLAGESIPLGARILAVANDYDAVQIGTLLSKKLNANEALEHILDGRGKRYDPQVVDAFREMMGGHAQNGYETIGLKSEHLKPGMILARDIVSKEGVMLLARDYVLTAAIIDQIRNFERSTGLALTILVRVQND